MLGLFTAGAKPIKTRDRNEYIVAHMLNTANVKLAENDMPRLGKRSLLQIRDNWRNTDGEMVDLAVEGLTVRNINELLKSTGVPEFSNLDVHSNNEHKKLVRDMFVESKKAYDGIANRGVFPHSILDPELRQHFPELVSMNRLTFELNDKSARSLNVGDTLKFDYQAGGQTHTFEHQALDVDWRSRKERADRIIAANTQREQGQRNQQRSGTGNTGRSNQSNQSGASTGGGGRIDYLSVQDTDRFIGWDGKQIGNVYYPGISSAIGAYLTESDAKITRQNIDDDFEFSPEVVHGSVELFKHMRSQGYDFNATKDPFVKNSVEVSMQTPTNPTVRMLDNQQNGRYMGRVYDGRSYMYFVDIPSNRTRQFSVEDSKALIDYSMGRKKGAVRKAKRTDSTSIELEGVARSRKLHVRPITQRYDSQIFKDSDVAKEYLEGAIDSARDYVSDNFNLNEIAELAQAQIDKSESIDSVDFRDKEYREALGQLLNKEPNIRESQQAVIDHIVENREVNIEELTSIQNDLIGNYDDGFNPSLTKEFMDLTGRGNERDALITALKVSNYEESKLKGNNFGVNSYREHMLKFDPETAKGIRDVNDPTLKLALRTVQDTLEGGRFIGPSGEASPEVLVDEQGIIKWSAQRPVGPKGEEHELVSGEIGQVMSPDEHGIIKTKFNSDNNFDFVPGYTGYFSFEGDYSNRIERLRAKGFEAHLVEQLQVNITQQMTRPYINALENIPTSLDATGINKMYQSDMYGKRIEPNYMDVSMLPEDEKLKNIQTLRGRVRFDNVYSDHATTGAETQYNLERRRALERGEVGGVDSLRGSAAAYSYWEAAGGKNMRVIAEDFENIFDSTMTGTGKTQGTVLYFVEGAEVNADHTITPSEGMRVRDIEDNRELLTNVIEELHSNENADEKAYQDALSSLRDKGVMIAPMALEEGVRAYSAVNIPDSIIAEITTEHDVDVDAWLEDWNNYLDGLDLDENSKLIAGASISHSITHADPDIGLPDDVLDNIYADLELAGVDITSVSDEQLNAGIDLYTDRYIVGGTTLENQANEAAMNDVSVTPEDVEAWESYLEKHGVTVKGTKLVPDKAPIPKSDGFRHSEYNAWDRNQMSANQIMDSERIDKGVDAALFNFGGWTTDDGFVVSKEFSDRNRIFGATPNHESMIELSKMVAELANDADPETGISQDENLNQKIDTGLDELGIKWSKDVVREGIELYAEKHGYGNNHLDEKQLLIDRDDKEANAEWQKEWGEYLNENGRFRPLERGDKLSDYGGNKGVISLVVDRNMTSQQAKKLDLEKEVAFMNANPDLDLVASPYSPTSRDNAGVIHSLMEGTPRDIYDPETGEVKLNAMGNIDILITNMKVDEKTKAYDEQDIREGKGRKASGQLAWALQSKGASEILSSVYGDNDKEWETLREYLIVTGLDMKPDGTIVKGYEAHEGENRTKHDPTVSASEFLNGIKEQGGFLDVPFEVEFRTGQKTNQIPIMSASLRDDVKLMDGTMRVDNYTKDYMQIYESIGKYNELHDSVQSGSANQKDAEAYQKAISNIHSSFNSIQSTVIDQEINGGHNGKNSFIRDRIMGKRMENSATGVAIADPRLDIGEAGMNNEMMSALGVDEGDTVMMFRDPVWRDGAIRAMTVKHDETANGVAFNPISDKSHDGDFDGDTMGLINLNDPKATAELEQLFSHEANMIDLGNGENELYFQDGMEMATGTYEAFERTGDESYLNMRDDIQDLARAGKNKEALDKLNEYSDITLRQYGYAGDYINLESADTVQASLKQIQERGAKGGGLAALDEYMEYHNGNMTDDDARRVQYATGVKSDDTGLAGSFSQKFVAIMRNDDIQSALESMYPITQGTLQIKKDAKKAEIVNRVLTEDLRTTLNGRSVDDPKIKLTPNEFKEQLTDILHDRENGLGVKVNEEFIDGVRDALTINGQIVSINKAFQEKGSPMDRVAYGGGFEELCKIADKGESLLEGKYNNLFAPDVMRNADKKTMIAKKDTQIKVEPEKKQENQSESKAVSEQKSEQKPATNIDESKDVVAKEPEPVLNEALLDELEKDIAPNHSAKAEPSTSAQEAQRNQQLQLEI